MFCLLMLRYILSDPTSSGCVCVFNDLSVFKYVNWVHLPIQSMKLPTQLHQISDLTT